jgi:hypothetical protein
MFIIALLLITFNPNRETVLEVDSSGYAVRGALMQYNNNRMLRLCVFFSSRNSLAECNYKIYNKELLIIIKCLR